MIPIKVYDNMNNENFENFNFEYGFKLMFVMPKNYNFDNPNYPPIFTFTPNINEISNNKNDIFCNV